MSDKPSKPGVYLAKTSEDYTWWNLVVIIDGEAPYLRVAAVYDRGKECLLQDRFVRCWGPCLEFGQEP